MHTPRRVLAVAFPDRQTLDVAGPVELFDAATPLRPGSYDVRLVARGGRAVTTPSRLELAAGLLSRRLDGVDTLVVAGGLAVVLAAEDEVLVGWVQRAARRVRRIASVCTGASAYVERLRVERARALLEDGDASLEHVAVSCGFAGAELLRRAFQRNLGVPPTAYREHFRSAA